MAFVYMLKCRDESFYVGTTRSDLGIRMEQHNSGVFGGYTLNRRPVSLVFHQEFESIEDAISAERQMKGWSRAKKKALIQGDWPELKRLARKHTKNNISSFDAGALRPAQDEVSN